MLNRPAHVPMFPLIARGEPRGFALFEERFGPYARALVRDWIPPAHQDDALQEIRLAIFRAAPFKSPEQETEAGYAVLIVRQTIGHVARRERRRRMVHLGVRALVGMSTREDGPPDTAARAEAPREARETMERMSPRMRPVFDLRARGASYRTVAALIGCHVGSIGPRMGRERDRVNPRPPTRKGIPC